MALAYIVIAPIATAFFELILAHLVYHLTGIVIWIDFIRIKGLKRVYAG